MSCASCGCDLANGAQFCVRCGQRTAYAEPRGWAPVMGHATPMPTMAPMPFAFTPALPLGRHVPLLGLCWCSYAVLGLFVRSMAGFGLLHGHVLGFSTVFFSLLALLAGVGLLARKPWARKLAIVLGVLCLFKFPIGLALGVYTLWVLGSRAARDQWRAIAVRRELW